MASNPRRFVFRPLTTNTGCTVDFPWCDRVPGNCPTVLSGHCEGPYKVLLGVKICHSCKCRNVSSVMAVTSAPVSILNGVSCLV